MALRLLLHLDPRFISANSLGSKANTSQLMCSAVGLNPARPWWLHCVGPWIHHSDCWPSQVATGRSLIFQWFLKTEPCREQLSGSSDAADCENLKDGLSCYFITPKTWHTLKSDSLLDPWNPRQREGQFQIVLNSWKADFLLELWHIYVIVKDCKVTFPVGLPLDQQNQEEGLLLDFLKVKLSS